MSMHFISSRSAQNKRAKLKMHRNLTPQLHRHSTWGLFDSMGTIQRKAKYSIKQTEQAAADSFLLKSLPSSVLRLGYTCELRKPPLNCLWAEQSRFSQPKELLKSKNQNQLLYTTPVCKVLSRFVPLKVLLPVSQEQKCYGICHSVVIPRKAWLNFFIGWFGNQTIRERPARKRSWSKPAWGMSREISPLGRRVWRRRLSLSWC